MRARGLKLKKENELNVLLKSRPMRARGLKRSPILRLTHLV